MIQPKAFLFDLNGTMINDMPYHAKAWYDVLNNDLKAGLTQEQVNAQMYGKNDELLVRVFGAGKFTQGEMDNWSMEKEKRYQKAYLPHLKLIDGLDVFLKLAHAQHIKMAIGSAAIPFNIDFILDNLQLRNYFPVIVSANDVKISKPHPEVFLKAAELLNVQPQHCVVFEDGPKGVEAALQAGMPAVVIKGMHAEKDFKQYNNVLAFVDDYSDTVLAQLLNEQQV